MDYKSLYEKEKQRRMELEEQMKVLTSRLSELEAELLKNVASGKGSASAASSIISPSKPIKARGLFDDDDSDSAEKEGSLSRAIAAPNPARTIKSDKSLFDDEDEADGADTLARLPKNIPPSLAPKAQSHPGKDSTSKPKSGGVMVKGLFDDDEDEDDEEAEKALISSVAAALAKPDAVSAGIPKRVASKSAGQRGLFDDEEEEEEESGGLFGSAATSPPVAAGGDGATAASGGKEMDSRILKAMSRQRAHAQRGGGTVSRRITSTVRSTGLSPAPGAAAITTPSPPPVQEAGVAAEEAPPASAPAPTAEELQRQKQLRDAERVRRMRNRSRIAAEIKKKKQGSTAVTATSENLPSAGINGSLNESVVKKAQAPNLWESDSDSSDWDEDKPKQQQVRPNDQSGRGRRPSLQYAKFDDDSGCDEDDDNPSGNKSSNGTAIASGSRESSATLAGGEDLESGGDLETAIEDRVLGWTQACRGDVRLLMCTVSHVLGSSIVGDVSLDAVGPGWDVELLLSRLEGERVCDEGPGPAEVRKMYL